MDCFRSVHRVPLVVYVTPVVFGGDVLQHETLEIRTVFGDLSDMHRVDVLVRAEDQFLESVAFLKVKEM